MKKLSLLLFLLLFAAGYTMAQRTISGIITDTDGEPLIGANVLVKGTAVGTITDIDGRYQLEIPEGSNTLVISYTGFTTQEIALGTSNMVDITLAEGLELEEIVVTGLGIKKEKKALGYGVTTISGESVSNRAEADVARILRGKAPGVDITQTSGMAGTGTNIIIRGYSSITGSNQPLFVVDGIPFDIDTNNDRNFVSGGATASSRFLDLDPNNIAEISILKGLSATVLYGELGRNGVVLVTTKTGSADATRDKGFEISVSQTVAQTEIANLPEFQNTYGNGFSGDYGPFFSNWGPSFDTRGSNGIDENGQIPHILDASRWHPHFPEFIGQKYDYKPYTNVEDFFSKGLSLNTSVSVDKNFEGGGFSASYSRLNDEGFTPERGEMVRSDDGTFNYVENGTSSNNYLKHNLGLGARITLANGLRVKGTFNFVSSTRNAPPASVGFGSNPSGPSVFANVIYTPRSVDLLHLPFQSPIDGSQIYYRTGGDIQNPLWGINNMNDLENIRRFFGSLDLSYDLTNWLTATYRVGVDQYAQENERAINKGGGPTQAPTGLMVTSDRLNKITDHLLNLIYNYQINEDLSLDGVLGSNVSKQSRTTNSVVSTNQFVFGLLNHGNFVNHDSGSSERIQNNIGVYLTASLGYRNFLYLNFQGRQDWISTLEPENRSIFYPSASVSFIPTEAISSMQNSNIVNYLKLRAGYGTSAGYPVPYQTRNVLSTGANVFLTPNNTVVNTNSVSNQLGNINLEPEKHKELEFGLEGRFLDNRVGVDVSYYNKQSEDLIIDLDLDPATGFTSTTVNAAELENKGVELSVNVVPVRGAFTWDFTVNYTKNDNTVIAIAEGVDEIPIAGFTNLGNFAIPGEPYGIIQGTPFDKNDAGEYLVTSIGEYVAGNDIEPLGDPNPNYTANLFNSFSWKGLSLGFQFSYVDGGSIYSQPVATYLARGNTTDTDVNRFLPVILPGVLASDGTTPNNIQGYLGDFAFNAYFFADEGPIFDGTVIRLREVSLAYDLPLSLLTNSPFGSASIIFHGENLWYNAPNFPVGTNYDPEVLSLGVGNGRGFDYITGPTSKKYGVTLNFTF